MRDQDHVVADACFVVDSISAQSTTARASPTSPTSPARCLSIAAVAASTASALYVPAAGLSSARSEGEGLWAGGCRSSDRGTGASEWGWMLRRQAELELLARSFQRVHRRLLTECDQPIVATPHEHARDHRPVLGFVEHLS